MELKKILQDAVMYMEGHLLEEISYEDVAKHVFLSRYNFHRTFSTIAGITANAYIRNRRLTLAGHELQTTDISVIDAALKYGYETPESFSKAFSKFHGISPIKAKGNGVKLYMFNPLVIKIIIEGGNMMDYRIVKKEKQKFVAKVRDYDNQNGDGVDENGKKIPEFWGDFLGGNDINTLNKLYPEGNEDMYGLCSPLGKDTTLFKYGIGVKINEFADESVLNLMLENGFSIWETESMNYVVFKCYGDNGDCIGDAWNKFFKEFLPNTSYEMAEGTDYELYPKDGEEGLFCELWIPVN